MTIRHPLSLLILAVFGASTAVAFSPSVPSWSNDHSYQSDGEFYFESYDASEASDWNQQVVSSWNDAAPIYCYEEDYQLSFGDYYLGFYNWQVQPFSLSEYINGLLVGYYVVPHSYVRLPYASYREVCYNYDGLEQPCYPWTLAGRTNTKLKPKTTAGSLFHYIYKVNMLANAYSGGVPFRPGNEVWFGPNLPVTTFNIAGRSSQADNRFYMVLPGNAPTDITPLSSSYDWYHYSVGGEKVVAAKSMKWLSNQYIAPAETGGYGVNPSVRQTYINATGDNRTGYHLGPNSWFCWGFQVEATVPSPIVACLLQGWTWHQDVESQQIIWRPSAPGTMEWVPGGTFPESPDAPMLPGNDELRWCADATPDQGRMMFLLDSPGLAPGVMFQTLTNGSWTILRARGEAWLSWADPQSQIEGIAAYQPWSIEIRLKVVNSAPSLQYCNFAASDILYHPITLSEVQQIVGYQ